MIDDIITMERLQKWKDNTIYLARGIQEYDDSSKSIRRVYDSAALDYLEEFVLLEIIPSDLNFLSHPFGNCRYFHEKSHKIPVISVYNHNLSVEEPGERNREVSHIVYNSRLMHEDTKLGLVRRLTGIPQYDFSMIYNQSFMDMLLIGHAYNNIKGNISTADAAKEIQMNFARVRSENKERYWGDFSRFLIALHNYEPTKQKR